MKKLLEKKINPLFAVMVTFLLGFFLVNDLNLRYIYVYAMLGVLLVAGIIMAGIWRPGMKLGETFRGIWSRVTPIKACFFFMVAVTTVLAFLPHSNLGHLVISLTISMLVFAAYLLFMEPGIPGIRRAFTAIHIMSILFSLYIIVVMLWPDFYWDHIYPHMGEYVQKQAKLLIPMGYGVPVGGSATYTDYVISIALLVNVGKIFIGDGIKSIKQFVFIVLSSVLYITAILLMGRRSEVLAIGAAGLVMLVLHLRSANKADGRKRLAAIVSILLVGALVLTPFVRGGYMERYVSVIKAILPEMPSVTTPVETEPSTEVTNPTEDATKPTVDQEPDKKPDKKPTADELTSGRTGLWKKAWALFKQKPVFGIGWEQFMNHNTYKHDVHNTYLQWLCEAGIVGFVLLMIPLACIWFMTLKRTIYYRTKGKNAPYALKEMNFVSLGMQTFLLAVNLIDPAYYHLNYFCFFALVVVLEDTSKRLDETSARSDNKCLLKAIWESAKLF